MPGILSVVEIKSQLGEGWRLFGAGHLIYITCMSSPDNESCSILGKQFGD